MLTKDIMITDVITISSNETVESAAKKMLSHNIGCLPVVEGDSIKGIITESDFIGKRVEIPHGIGSIPELLGEWFQGVSVESILTDVKDTTVDSVMSKNLIFVNPDTPLTETVNIMMNQKKNRLPVIEEGKLKGIIARRDVLGAFDFLKKQS